MIIDYSTARPSPSALRQAGVTGVLRYIGWDSVPGYSSIGKNITKGEADALLAGKIEIGLVFEYATTAALNGSNQGAADGKLATSQLTALGAPAGMTVYFALDWDVPDFSPNLPDTAANARVKLGPVASYFDGIRAQNLSYEVGGYGGYYVIRRLIWAKLIAKGWQTLAWSGGQVDQADPQVVLLQNLGAPPLAGTDTDIREHAAVTGDWGQWPRPAGAIPAPSPSPAPAPSPWPVPAPGWRTIVAHALPMLSITSATDREAVKLLQRLIGGGVVDGAFSTLTDTLIRSFQSNHGLVIDGIVGPVTWGVLL